MIFQKWISMNLNLHAAEERIENSCRSMRIILLFLLLREELKKNLKSQNGRNCRKNVQISKRKRKWKKHWRDAKAIKLKERMKKVKREQHSDQNRAEWSESCWTSKEKSWKCLKGRRQRPSIFTRKKNSLRTELASAAFWSDFNPFSLL